MSTDQSAVIVAAVGCAMAGDDAIGLHLAAALKEDLKNMDIRFWEDADSLTVAHDLLGLSKPVFLIDCADMGLPGGVTRVLDPGQIKMTSSTVSCHGFGLADAIGLAMSLGLQASVRIFGVQPFSCSPGTLMSPEMVSCFDRILLECKKAVTTYSLEQT